MRHVLIICYDFPRVYAAGVIRTYQFAKRLPDFGWQPVILTAQDCANREDNIETSDGALQGPKFTTAGSRFLLPIPLDPPPRHSSLGQLTPKGDSGFKGLVRFATHFALPDGKIGWLYPAFRRGLEIARSHPIKMCFSSSPRPTAHLAAYRLARRLKVPWVADFALPWSDAYWLAKRPRFIGWLDQGLENLVARSAQQITVAYPEIAGRISAPHSCRSNDKVAVIPTGFEEDLFAQPTASLSQKFTVVYPGNHFCEEGRDSEYFFKAIDEWLALNPRLLEKGEFHFIGKRDETLFRHRATMTHPEVIHIEPVVSHRACIRAIRSSHACVVNTVGNRIPGKVYECMRAGKWILALAGPGSDLATTVQDYPKAVVVSPTNTSHIRRALQKIWDLTHAEMLESSKHDGFLSRYSAKRSAESLAVIFDRLFAAEALSQ